MVVAIHRDNRFDLDRCRFIETDFDGFEFSRHRDELRGNWRSTATETEDNPSYDDLEMTYLRAKNGATDGSDSKAASEFFLREMKYRRKNTWNLAATGGGLLACSVLSLLPQGTGMSEYVGDTAQRG